MARPVDETISERVLRSAERRLAQGLDAVTMRAVSEETGIALTTIYARFGSREGLMVELGARLSTLHMDQLRLTAHSAEDVFDGILRTATAHPNHMQVMVESFFERRAKGAPMPGLDLIREFLDRDYRVTAARRDNIAFGMMLLAVGTARGLTLARNDADRSTVTRAGKAALRLILAGTRNVAADSKTRSKKSADIHAKK